MEGIEPHERLGRRAGRRADVSDNGTWLGRWRVAVTYAFIVLLVGSCAPQSHRPVVTNMAGYAWLATLSYGEYDNM